MDNYYFCDPEKNVNCKKDACYINNGPCNLTSYKEFAKPKTNQDKIAEMVKEMDTEKLALVLAGIEECDLFVCEHGCPIYEQYGYSRCPEGKLCVQSILEWLKEECKE